MKRIASSLVIIVFCWCSSVSADLDVPLLETEIIDVTAYKVDQKVFKRAVARAGLYSRWTVDWVHGNTIFLSRDYGKKGQAVLKARVSLIDNKIRIDGAQKYWKPKAGKFRTLKNDILSYIQQYTINTDDQNKLPRNIRPLPEGVGSADGNKSETVSFPMPTGASSEATFRKATVEAFAKTHWLVGRVEPKSVIAFRTIKDDVYTIRAKFSDGVVELGFISVGGWAKTGWLERIQRYINYYAEWDLMQLKVAKGEYNTSKKGKQVVSSFTKLSMEDLAQTIVIPVNMNKLSESQIRTLLAENFRVLQWTVKEAGSNYIIATYNKEGVDRFVMQARFHDGAIYLYLLNQNQEMRFNWIRTIRDRIAASVKIHELGMN